VGGATIVGWNALGMVTIMQNVPRRSVGVSAARMLRGFFIGLAVGPFLFGSIVQATTYSVGWVLQGVVLVLAVVAAMIFGRSLSSATRSSDDSGGPDDNVD